jgi:hypothetical protein
MLMKQRNWWLILSLIVSFGFFLRIISIEQTPSGFSPDVLLYFINARAIAQTGLDIYGKAFPLYFSLKDFLVNPTPVYFGAFFHLIFGYAPWVSYLPNVVASTLSLVGAALLAETLFPRKRIGLYAAAILTISPWHLHLSRTGFEGVLGFCLVLWGIYFSIIGIKIRPLLFLAIPFFLLGTFSYKAVNVFILGYAVIYIFYLRYIHLQIKQYLFFIFLMLFSVGIQWFLLFYYYHDAYANGVILKNDLYATERVNKERFISDAPMKVRFIFSNKPLVFVQTVTENYLNFFSPQFLLTHGDADVRFSTQFHGQLYLIDSLLILFGVVWLIRTRQVKNLFFLLAILLISPLSSAISDQQYSIRAFEAVFIFAILIGCGIEYITMYVIKKHPKYHQIILGAGVGIYLLFAAGYLYRYYFLYQYYERATWNGVNRKVMENIYSLRKNYSKITFGVSSEFEYLEFFYWNNLPFSQIQEKLNHYPEKPLVYENILFTRVCSGQSGIPTLQNFEKKELLITRNSCFPNLKPLRYDYYPKSDTYDWKEYDYDTLKTDFVQK